MLDAVWLGSLLGIGAARAADAPVRLETPALTLEVAPSPAPHIARLVHKASGTSLLAEPLDKNLFVLRLTHGDGRQETIESSRAKTSSVRLETSAAGVRAHLDYAGFGDLDLVVQVTADSSPQDPLLRWAIRVPNAPGRRLTSVRFPVLTLAPRTGDPAGDCLILPALPGTLIENAAASWPVSQSATLRYPGDLSAQFIAYQDRTAGVYLASQDTDSHPLQFSVARRTSGFAVQHEFVPLPGADKDWVSPYAVVLGVTQGRWYDTADIYKAWAVKQRWCATRLAERPDVPDWWKAGPLVHVLEVRKYNAQQLNSGSYYPQLVEHLRNFQKQVEGPVVPMLAGWENHRRWTAGDYFPVFDQDQAARILPQLQPAGFRPFFYLSGLFYTFENEGRDGSRIEAAERFAPHYVLDQTTHKPRVFALDESSPSGVWRRQSYEFCVGAPETTKFFCDVIDQAQALGVHVLQMDQTVQGAGNACYATNHAHAPGVGLYQTHDFQKLLTALRQHGQRRNPDFVLLHEEPHEQLMPSLDGFHVREYYEKRWYRSQPGAVGIPLFSYLYHEYALGYGGDSAGVSSQNNRWLLRNHALNLVTGRTPGVAVWSNQAAALTAHADQVKLLRNHCRLLKTKARDYLLLGRMLHPLEFDAPQLRFAIDGGDRRTPRKVDIVSPAVLTSSWQSPAGQVGHLFVNISEQQQAVHVALDTRNAPAWATGDVEVYRSEGDAVWQRWRQNASLPVTFDANLEPSEVVFVELRATAGK